MTSSSNEDRPPPPSPPSSSGVGWLAGTPTAVTLPSGPPPSRDSRPSLIDPPAENSNPPWLHGVSLGKDEDRALLQDPATGEYPDGWFFVAELGQDSSNYPGHVLNINFRGKATRHLVKTDEATGFLLVNKKAYGDFATVADLVDAITQKPLPPNWPVFASHPVVANTD
jgi:hypothetical protein